MRYAVLDLGSTSFQLLVAEVPPDGSLTPILRDRVILNLGAALAPDRHIEGPEADRAAMVVRRFRDIAERAGASEVLPIATSALRDAGNRDELDELLSSAARAQVRFIDGAEEGRLTFRGILGSVATGPGLTLALDLGGGSLEVAIGDPKGLRWADSFPLGAARLTRTHVEGERPTRPERRAIRALVREQLGPIAGRAAGAERCVASGGTAGALARLLAARRFSPVPASLNQFAIPLDALTELSRTLGTATVAERLAMPGIDVRRADLLPVGALVLATAVEALGAGEAIHSEWGLREGVVLDHVGTPVLADPDELRAASVDRLCRLWGIDEAHTHRVRELSLRLFDATRELHRLGGRERDLLEYAATVHDIGVRISPDRHHKHGAYLVENAGLRGFSPDEIAIMASSVRFQRGSGPKVAFAPFAALGKRDAAAAAILAGILRVAHGLGRGSEEHEVEVGVDRGRVSVSVSGPSDPTSAVQEARDRVEVLEKALGASVRVRIARESVAR